MCGAQTAQLAPGNRPAHLKGLENLAAHTIETGAQNGPAQQKFDPAQTG
jgi:hypothetical protein